MAFSQLGKLIVDPCVSHISVCLRAPAWKSYEEAYGFMSGGQKSRAKTGREWEVGKI